MRKDQIERLKLSFHQFNTLMLMMQSLFTLDGLSSWTEIPLGSRSMVGMFGISAQE